MNYLIRCFAGLFGAVLTGALVIGCIAERPFYYPVRGESAYTPQEQGLAYEDVYFSSRDGTKLHGWFIPAVGESKGVVLHVHGNTGKIGGHFGIVSWLPRERYDVFMFDYRGYGLSDDESPSPRALMEDTQAAFAWLRQRPDVDPERIMVLGQSLGGNNSIAALALPDENGKTGNVAGVVLDATFESYSAVASDHVPVLGWLLSDRYSANRHIRKLQPIPLLFLHGDQDTVISWQHSQRLFDAALPPKQIRIIPGAEHVRALDDLDTRQEVLRFFEFCLNPYQAQPSP
ncbi:MAG: alpha/beta hydrolase [Betaproteobacteria bacterium]|nr:alpha/beta hydrolase [Betaproteobacteria bacterium]